MTRDLRPVRVAYSREYLKWRLGVGHPTNPERAAIAVDLIKNVLPESQLEMIDAGVAGAGPLLDDLERALCKVHDPNYVDRVLTYGDLGDEADEKNPDLGDAALAMFNGTYQLVERCIGEGARAGVWFNPAGAKHHALWDRASGFCAFNDMAWAALRFADLGLRVGYLDWDVHAGDGVQALVGDADAVTYFSIHQQGIFPGQRWTLKSYADAGIYNRVLREGADDSELLQCVQEARSVFRDAKVDVVLLAAGADGLLEDPLGGLAYTLPGLYKAARWMGRSCALRNVPLIIGGAGGYTPLKQTPMAWAGVVASAQVGMNTFLSAKV